MSEPQAIAALAPSERKTIEESQLDIICKPTIAIPIASMLVAITLAFMAFDTHSKTILLPWLAVIFMTTTARFVALRLWIPSLTHKTAAQKLRLAFIFSLAAGFAMSFSVFFFFGYSPLEKAIQTIVITSMCMTTIVSVAGYLPHLLAYAAPNCLALITAWIINPNPENKIVELLLAGLTTFFLLGIIQWSKLYNRFFIEAHSNQERLEELNHQISAALMDSEAANQSKNLFFASASHDLRQPIHTLSLLTAALSMREMDSKAQDILVHIETAVENLSLQMDSMLDIAKLDAGVFEADFRTVDCNSLLAKLANEYSGVAEQKGLKLSLLQNNTDQFVYSDPELLERVIRNLIDNAIKYTPEGMVNVRLFNEDSFTFIEVKDTGVGISDHEKMHVFDEFYQVDNPSRDRKQGLGLGLSIVKRMTDLLDISLDFDSTAGEGTTFTLTLMPVNATAPVNVAAPRAAHFNDKTLLCVDDEEDVLNAMQFVLQDLGIQVLTASSTEEAVQLLHRTTPDAVLADFRLGPGDNGIKAIEALRQVIPNLRALLISGDTGRDSLVKADAANIPMLSKPLSAEKLESALNGLFS